MFFTIRRHQFVRSLANLLFVAICPLAVVAASAAHAQTFATEQIERRIVIGFNVNAEALQGRLPPPWQLNPLSAGSLKGANFLIVLVDNMRTEDPHGKVSVSGALRFAAFVAPATNPQTGQTVSVVLSGFASNPAYVPGFYQVYKAATVRVQHAINSREGDADEQIDVWEVVEQSGKTDFSLRLSTVPDPVARSRLKSETNVISAKNPMLWRTYKYDTLTDTVKSTAQHIDHIQNVDVRMQVTEYADLFNGSEQLLGINLVPWYIRQVYVH